MKLDDIAERLCASLPLGWRVRIEMERHAATVQAIRPDDSKVVMGDGESDLYEQVMDAARLAHDETEANKLTAYERQAEANALRESANSLRDIAPPQT